MGVVLKGVVSVVFRWFFLSYFQISSALRSLVETRVPSISESHNWIQTAIAIAWLIYIKDAMTSTKWKETSIFA